MWQPIPWIEKLSDATTEEWTLARRITRVLWIAGWIFAGMLSRIAQPGLYHEWITIAILHFVFCAVSAGIGDCIALRHKRLPDEEISVKPPIWDRWFPPKPWELASIALAVYGLLVFAAAYGEVTAHELQNPGS